MGSARRPIPKKLGLKLFLIRMRFNLNYKQMIERLEYEETPLFESHIAEFELGKREPNLLVLLRYARLIGEPMDVLVDDNMSLPGEAGILMLLSPKAMERMDRITGRIKPKKRQGSKRKSK